MHMSTVLRVGKKTNAIPSPSLEAVVHSKLNLDNFPYVLTSLAETMVFPTID